MKQGNGDCRRFHLTTRPVLLAGFTLGIAVSYFVVCMLNVRQDVGFVKEMEQVVGQMKQELKFFKGKYEDLAEAIKHQKTVQFAKETSSKQAVPPPGSAHLKSSGSSDELTVPPSVLEYIVQLQQLCMPENLVCRRSEGKNAYNKTDTEQKTERKQKEINRSKEEIQVGNEGQRLKRSANQQGGLKGDKGDKGDRGLRGFPCENGSASTIRLIGGLNEWEGRIEILHNGVWGTICGREDDFNVARVACRQMNRGYSGAMLYKRYAYYGQGSGMIWMENPRCTGAEASLAECTFKGWGMHKCGSHCYDAGVVCAGDIRIANGLHAGEGRVEVLHNGTWGTVCHDGWDLNDAHVACRQLGYFRAKEILHFGRGTGAIWMKRPNCIGTESSLTQCRFGGWGSTGGCDHSMDAGVICTADIKLVTNRVPYGGEVKVLVNDVWHDVCNDAWDLNDAHVACRQLGFFRAKSYERSSSWGSTTTRKIKSLVCSGNEASLLDCRFQVTDVPQYCSNGMATVTCATNIRLAGGTSTSGRVEILWNGMWGAVCDDGWDISNAHVACRQLGFYRAKEYQTGRSFGGRLGRVWMSTVRCRGHEASLHSCSFGGWGISRCGPSESAEIVCISNIRLAGGALSHEGRVEILHNGKWGTICDNGWSISDAQVACRQLGYYTAKTYTSQATFGQGTGDVWMDHVCCTGPENSLEFCTFNGWGTSSCSHSRDAGAVCSKPDLQLVRGSFPGSGRVEVFYNNTWGGVCSDNFDINDANVVCRELDFPAAIEYSSFFGNGIGPTWMSNVSCKGYETNLTDCNFDGWGRSGSCSQSRDVGVICERPIRLVGGSEQNEGRVEIFHNGEWGTVCDDTWNEEEAQVVCKELGFPAAERARGSAYFGRGSGHIWMDDIVCRGQETNLTRCRFNGWGIHNCGHNEDASVVCQRLRLAGGSETNEGRVEIFINGTWGTVCDDNWDYTDAHVVCRELGFPTATTAKRGAYFGQGSGPVLMNSVSCLGGESNLTDCSYQSLGQCNHRRDAGVICTKLRLAGSSSRHQGRVEVFHNGIWGTVCDDGWDLTDAHVVCKELGFTTAASAKGQAYFGQGTGPVWMDDLVCNGHETNLTNCKFNGWKVENCVHGEDAGVICDDIRLVGSLERNKGRVEVFHNGIWGTVCDDSWDLNDADVVCRQLGFVRATKAVQSFGGGSGTIWMDDLVCHGNEKSLDSCYFNGWGSHNCGHSEDAGVVCSAVRLVAGCPYEGRVEIFHEGRWGTVCDDGWDLNDARVVCKELGFPRASSSGTLGYGSGPIWMDDVNCGGSEERLSDCSFREWGRHNCGHSEDSSVVCEANTRIVNGGVPYQGRVEVLHNGVWGTVCDDNWDLKDGHVSCRELGYRMATEIKTSAYFGQGSGPIFLDDVNCDGTEKGLSDCKFPSWGSHNCVHGEDAGVVCER
eukprot:m.224758 g.224758  ORF g.224758 m.224758 type:complete len:1431 (+) comp40003_c2_seq6:15-4307(+)